MRTSRDLVKAVSRINPLVPSIPFLGPMANSVDPDQPQNVASDQGLHCLFTGISIKNIEKMHQTPLNWKWTHLVDMDGWIGVN